MGKAVIVSGGHGGWYVIRRVYPTQQRDKLLADLQRVISGAESDINRIQPELTALENESDQLAAELEALIAEYAAESQSEEPDLAPFQQRIEQAQMDTADLAERIRPVRASLQDAKGRKLAAEKRVAVIEGADPVNEFADCVDYTEDLAPGTEVATIELPGEPQKVVIAPGGRAHTPADGILMPTEWMTPAQAFLNTAILPGVQRWRQVYRTGIIWDVDYEADTCLLKIENERSSQQRLSVNWNVAFESVPIEYMGCGAKPFGVGDNVVAEMEPSGRPVRVIGFVRWPRSCVDDPLDKYFPRFLASEGIHGVQNHKHEIRPCSGDPTFVFSGETGVFDRSLASLYWFVSFGLSSFGSPSTEKVFFGSGERWPELGLSVGGPSSTSATKNFSPWRFRGNPRWAGVSGDHVPVHPIEPKSWPITLEDDSSQSVTLSLSDEDLGGSFCGKIGVNSARVMARTTGRQSVSMKITVNTSHPPVITGSAIIDGVMHSKIYRPYRISRTIRAGSADYRPVFVYIREDLHEE